MDQSSAGFGVVGLGVWGENHLKAYGGVPGCQVVGVCDLVADLARQRAEQYGIPFWTTDYRELLTRPGLDAVSIVTPDFAHYEVALAAARAGKHLLVEKPLATSLAEAQSLAQAAEQADVLLMVDFHNRWNPAFAAARRAVEQGEVGEVQMVSLLLNDTLWVPTEMLSWASRSSVAWFLASHLADLARWLTGQEVVRVYAVARSRVLAARGVDTPDFFQSLLEMEGGAVVHLENCWIMANSQPNLFDLKMELFGAEGSLYVDMATHRMMQKYTAGGGDYPDMAVVQEIQGRYCGFGIESIRHFARCVLGREQPLISPRDAVENVRIVAALHESAQTGQPVALR
jgi:predicted dehydrogenase